jgi:hypothetical protein
VKSPAPPTPPNPPAKKKPVTPEPPKRLPWPEDATLREHGFVIQSRPAGGGAVWRRGEHYYCHAEALVVAQVERARALAALEASASGG